LFNELLELLEFLVLLGFVGSVGFIEGELEKIGQEFLFLEMNTNGVRHK
jgi:hypothetical protein